jgi:hypothetical protein
MRELAKRLEALETEVRDLREALTPHAELRLAVNQMRKRARRIPARELDRDLDRALREVRRERVTRTR